MTASEFTFLALGLVLGVASGAALIEVLRARPPVPREVRVTISPDAIPRRRASTLSDDAFATAGPEPARGGPADRRFSDDPMPGSLADRRTNVRSTPGIPVFPGATGVGTSGLGAILEPSVRSAASMASGRPPEDLVGIPVAGGVDPVLAALRVSAMTAAMKVGDAVPIAAGEPALHPASVQTAVAVMEAPRSSAADRSTDAASGPASGPATSGGDGAGSAIDADVEGNDTCAAERRIAAERCGLAVRARAGATEAADAVRAAQRAYDEHMVRAEEASALSDPRAIRREKEAAQARFRMAYNGAQSTDEQEAAARDWLSEINDVNNTARAAVATAERERASGASIGASLERMTIEADAARIAAETAEAACMAARQALAECDERSVTGVIQPLPPAPWTERPGPSNEDDEPLAAALHAGGTPTIFRLLRGDRTSLVALVERLGGDDPAARRRWQLGLTDLVDGIVAVSIEAGALEFPADHVFWGTFTLVQDREIAQALASLGYRFDGLGGFADERVPSQRDLSLALGYAGLDPMRIRHWPTETEMAALFEDVTVAADEHLAATAGDLSLGELVALLGRRADGLADLWNDWGHVRPLLLEGA